jgi:acetyltransferase-like isoleucine patch superfamily enzyme
VRRPIRLLEPKNVYIGENVLILDGLRMEAVTRWGGSAYTPRIEFGDNVAVGQNCHFTAANKIHVGSKVSILPQVLITDIEHCYETGKSLLETGITVGEVVIEDFAVIGMGARILGSKGVHIGKNAVVGTNAVVLHDVPDRAIVAGVPAKIVGYVSE